MRGMVGTISLGLALILPAVAASQQKSADGIAATSSSPARVCTADGEGQLTTVNAEYVWRLRAYDSLDCALAILEEALKAPGSTVVLSRQEAEQARASLWSARDAAARIGR